MGCGSSKPSEPEVVRAKPGLEVPNGTEDRASPPVQPERVQPAKQAEQPYTGAPLPCNEEERKSFLDSLNILDTEPERRFDDITKLCCMIFKVPIALVSLVDTNRQWFKSVQGLEVDNTDRTSSFCAWTLLPANPEALVVEDALEDARFRFNALVTGFPFIRFYAGAPLIYHNGMRLGSLCIIDNRPRTFDAESCNVLANMAEMVVREVEKAHALATQRIQNTNTQLLRAIDCFSEGIMLLNVGDPSWRILYVNDAWTSVLGVSRDQGQGKSFWDLFQFQQGSTAGPESTFAAAIAAGRKFSLDVIFSPPAGAKGERRALRLRLRCALSSTGAQGAPLIGIPNFLPASSSEAPSLYFATVEEPAASTPGRPRPTPSSQASASSLAAATPASASGTPSLSRSSTPSAFRLEPSNGAFDDIRLGPLLGKGAFGRVYRGMWNGAQVAVKVIDYVDGEGQMLEGLLHTEVSHPNVVQTFKFLTRSAGPADDAPVDAPLACGPGSCSSSAPPRRRFMEAWLVLEFCNRGCLSDAVARGWFRERHSLFDVDVVAVLRTALEVAAALACLHDRGILHGDLTGNNVLLTARGGSTGGGGGGGDTRSFMAKVSDFGLARVLPADQLVIQTRSYGTVTHMPPELLLSGELSKAADTYSFGVLLWEMYVGHRPFAGMTHSQVLHAVSRGKGLELPPHAPPALRDLMAGCLARSPAERPTFAHILSLLQDAEKSLAKQSS